MPSQYVTDHLLLTNYDGSKGIAVSTAFGGSHLNGAIDAGQMTYTTWIYKQGSHGGHPYIDNSKWVSSGAASHVSAVFGDQDLCGATYSTIRSIFAMGDPFSSYWP
tara:strand:+ start:86 stop:403 length:318 start_codon:yes stop_codon:yes gene_type:complete